MNSFGKLKSKLLTRISESYSEKNMTDVKNILEIIKENKNFKELYLFYEEIENKYFEDKNTAKVYVESITTLLKDKNKELSNFNKLLYEHVSDLTHKENEVYEYLDILSEDDSLLNIDKKVIAKDKLINFLTTKKETVKIDESKTLIPNLGLLNAVLVNNFNVLYSDSLNEGQKKELKDILSFTDEELNEKTKEIKESIHSKIGGILSESKYLQSEVISKLESVKKEVNSMEISKYNYYKLRELKNGL
jgi:hypothetical protein